MTEENPTQEEFLFVVPSAAEPEPGQEAVGSDPELRRDVRLPFTKRARELGLTPEDLQQFWNSKVVGLTGTIEKADKTSQTGGFQVDEISFSIGFSAKGGLAFVAEAGVEAAIAVTLRRVKA
jgi:hypothetical protein